MKYVKSKVKKEEPKQQPQEERQEREPTRMTMHNITAMWKGLFKMILIAALITVIFYTIQVLWILGTR